MYPTEEQQIRDFSDYVSAQLRYRSLEYLRKAVDTITEEVCECLRWDKEWVPVVACFIESYQVGLFLKDPSPLTLPHR